MLIARLLLLFPAGEDHPDRRDIDRSRSTSSRCYMQNLRIAFMIVIFPLAARPVSRLWRGREMQDDKNMHVITIEISCFPDQG